MSGGGDFGGPEQFLQGFHPPGDASSQNFRKSGSSSAGRLPPQNLEAERSILGAVLVNNETLDSVREVGLEPSDFYVHSHQRIFECACDLSDRRKPIDLVTLTGSLRDKGWYEEVGGSETLTSLFDDAFAMGNISQYATIVRDKSTQRKMIDTCSKIISTAFTGVEDNEVFLDDCESQVFKVAESQASQSFAQLKDILMDNMASIEELALRKEEVVGLSTGFRDFDKLTTGLHPGQVMVLAARPGMGKTSWFLSSLQHSAIKQNSVIALFSLEMSKEEMGFRFLSGLSRIDSRRLKIGKLADRDWHALAEAADLLAKSSIYIDDSGGLTIMELRSKARRLLAKAGKLDMIVIDYLQLMQGSKHARSEGSREREISEISRNLKELAKELKVPIIALSQLNRGVEARQDKRPTLSDLRESGAIEQDADLVCFIHREDYYDKESEDKGIAEFIVAKNRAGETKTVRLAWLPQYTLFANLAEDEEGQPVNSGRPDKGDITL